jgi:tetratricopeptide (TPR) repeat protein
MLIEAAFDFPLYNPASGILFWTVAGTVTGLRRESGIVVSSEPVPRLDPKCAPQPSFRLRTAAVVFVLLTVTVYGASQTWYRYLVSEVWNRFGVALSDHGRYPEAVAALRRSQVIAPDNRETYPLLTRALRNNADFAEAEAAAIKWLELEPSFSAAHNELGFALASAGKDSQALAAFMDALRIAPTSAAAAINAGTILYQNACYDEAYNLFKYGLSIDSASFAPVTWRSYANAAIETRRAVEARKILQEYSNKLSVYRDAEARTLMQKADRIIKEGNRSP